MEDRGGFCWSPRGGGSAPRRRGIAATLLMTGLMGLCSSLVQAGPISGLRVSLGVGQ